MLRDGRMPLRITRENSRSYVEFRRLVRKDPCAYCGRRPPFCVKVARNSDRMTADHIIPRSEGGPNKWMNLTGACARCNQRKQSESLLHYMLSRLPG